MLIVVAAPLEAAAVARAFDKASHRAVRSELWSVQRLSGGFRLLETGIGKVNAAGALVRALGRSRYRAVVNLGVGGSLPGSGLAMHQVVVGSASVYADEGLGTPAGFVTCEQMGFPLGPFHGNAVAAAPGLLERLTPLVASERGRCGAIATVSTCSGTDELARGVVERTGAIAEGMEGAAVGHAAARFSDLYPRGGAPFIEVRVISNTTGNREEQRWDVRGALGRLTEAAVEIRAALDGMGG